MNAAGHCLPSFHPGSFEFDRIAGFALFLALAWYSILKPAVFGLNQMLGRFDPPAEAMGGLGEGLEEIFGDIHCLARASVPELLAKAACVPCSGPRAPWLLSISSRS